MKPYISKIGLAILTGFAATAWTSCNDQLDLEPITQITPDMYYRTADQLANYVNAYYNAHLSNPFSGAMYHQAAYNDGLNRSDVNTDIACIGGGNTTLFTPTHWEVPDGKALQGYYNQVRVWNNFLTRAEENYAAGNITGSDEAIKNYIGEGYFFRALAYYRILAYFGDAPILTEVLPDVDEVIVENSQRAPRNEVARFILSDLDKAISICYPRSSFNGQRVSREAAALLKSRVALFEGTFEKYHRGSGRVPGDANWPGASKSYNSGKTFDISGEIDFFLTEAMSAAKIAVGNAVLTTNNKVLEPEVGTVSGFNPYFEMYSQASLSNVDEVLLWKEYNADLNVKHNAPYRTLIGCNDGMTRAFVEGFLMTDGKPWYASNLYKGDKSVDDTKVNRDYRAQLFLWSENTISFTDRRFNDDCGKMFGVPDLNDQLAETRAVTGYQSRKYLTYDYSQTWHDQILGVNACPIFRIAEAMLNYMEACVEKTGNVDGTAADYWHKLRVRAGVDPDFNITIAATDMSKELQLSAYSGQEQVSPLLFNIRRERVCETFNEGLRMADLIRWRSFDRMITTKWIPEGVNFWDEMYKDEHYDGIICDGSTNSTVSGRELGKYVRPYSASMSATNELRDGYQWMEAFYLYPLGNVDLTSASPDRTVENSNMYQNLYWPNDGGSKATK